MQSFVRGRDKLAPYVDTAGMRRRDVLALAALGLVAGAPGSAIAAGPDGQLTWGVHVSLAPVWFDPADVSGIITPFMVLYALHDAMVKPMPGQSLAPSLAESWSASEDGLTYDFALRQGAMFHNGDPVTAEDVKFSFERYRGASHDLMMERVAAVEIPDPRHVRFKLKRPWPDFLTFYASATGAGWIVPKKYVEKVGDEGFKKAPIGAGPYKFVSFNPGVELVLEAFDQYWRKPPSVKRLVFKVIPDETHAAGRAQARRDRHRLLDPRRARRGAAAHAGAHPEAGGRAGRVLPLFPRPVGPEIAVARRAGAAGRQPGDRPRGHERGADPRLLADHRQPDRSGPLRILLAAAGPGLRPGQGQAAARRGGLSQRLRRRRLLLRLVLREYRRGGARQSAGGRHSRQSCGRSSGRPSSRDMPKRRSRTSSRPAPAPSATPRPASRLMSSRAASLSTAATPISTSSTSSRRSSSTTRSARRSCTRCSRSVYERTIYAPIWQLAFINGVGPRVGESGFGLIPRFPYTAPYEDITLKGRVARGAPRESRDICALLAYAYVQGSKIGPAEWRRPWQHLSS